jgi:hypothetical protein
MELVSSGVLKFGNLTSINEASNEVIKAKLQAKELQQYR